MRTHRTVSSSSQGRQFRPYVYRGNDPDPAPLVQRTGTSHGLERCGACGHPGPAFQPHTHTRAVNAGLSKITGSYSQP